MLNLHGFQTVSRSALGACILWMSQQQGEFPEGEGRAGGVHFFLLEYFTHNLMHIHALGKTSH